MAAYLVKTSSCSFTFSGRFLWGFTVGAHTESFSAGFPTAGFRAALRRSVRGVLSSRKSRRRKKKEQRWPESGSALSQLAPLSI
jgi:hypothetical protein